MKARPKRTRPKPQTEAAPFPIADFVALFAAISAGQESKARHLSGLERAARERDLEPARAELEWTLAEFRRVEARSAEILAKGRKPFGLRADGALTLDDPAGTAAPIYASYVDLALSFLKQGRVEPALTAVCYVLRDLAAALELTALGLKNADRGANADARSKGSGIGRPPKIKALERAEIVRIASKLRADTPGRYRSNLAAANGVISKVAKNPGRFRRLATRDPKLVAKVIAAELGPRKPLAEG